MENTLRETEITRKLSGCANVSEFRTTHVSRDRGNASAMTKGSTDEDDKTVLSVLPLLPQPENVQSRD